MVKKITFNELTEQGRKGKWEEAVIVFTTDSFKGDYSEVSRSYKVSSDEKHFDSFKSGSSLHGDCLDGNDNGVRLDLYLHDSWTVDYCYIIE